MKKKIVLASGKFDVLHPGHIYYLKKSSNLVKNSKLYVVLAHEKNIENCIFPKEARKMMLEAFEFVDKVIIGEKNRNYINVLESLKPDIISLGYDQDEGPIGQAIEEMGLKSKIMRVGSLKPDTYSSSKIKKGLISGK